MRTEIPASPRAAQSRGLAMFREPRNSREWWTFVFGAGNLFGSETPFRKSRLFCGDAFPDEYTCGPLLRIEAVSRNCLVLHLDHCDHHAPGFTKPFRLEH